MEPHEEKENNDLNPIVFRPITEGLGFHHQAEPETASPQVKKAALRAKSAYQSTPQKSSQQQNLKPNTVVNTVQPQPVLPQRPVPPTVTSPVKTTAPHVTTSAPQPAPQPAPQIFLDRTAPFLSRACAYLIDIGVHGLIGSIVLSVLLFRADISLEILRQPWALAILGVALYFTHALLLTLQEIVFQTSVGKKILGLQVSGNPFILFLRAVVFHLTFFIFGVGPLMALFRKDKRALHDVITDTTVQTRF